MQDWFYNHRDNGLCLTFKALVECGVQENTLKVASSRGARSWGIIDHPEDGRRKLIVWNKLRNCYREKVNKMLKRVSKCKHDEAMHCECGDPVKYFALEPIRQLLNYKDFKAEEFFLSYEYQGNKKLAPQTIRKYTREASLLNRLLVIKKDTKKFVKELHLEDVPTLYSNICAIINNEKEAGKIERNETEYQVSGNFPATYQRLLKQIEEYAAGGYVSLIDTAIGNSYAAKVNDCTSEAMLLRMIEHPNQYDDVMICYLYNKWAVSNNYKKIDAATVGVWRRKKEADIAISRQGNSYFNEKFIRQVKGFAPTKVGMLWESDDYNLNYYYQDAASDKKVKDMERYVSYIVADSKTGLVLGKCYRQAKSPCTEMVRLAYIDAMYYVRKLTATDGAGTWYLPFEIKTDHWQESNLFPFFKSLAHFVPPAHANKHRGYIEQLFGSPHAKRAEKMAAHKEINYNGNNVTATNWGVNTEALHDNRKNRPMVGDGAEMQLEKFFYYMRHMPAFTRENMDEVSKEEQWLSSWSSLSQADKRSITDEQFLLLFGFRHLPGGRQITITNRGVEPQINGVKYSYDLPNSTDALYLIDRKVTVIYDPYDMSRILITDDKNIRMVLRSAQLNPRALADTYTNSRTALNMVLSDKKHQVQHVTSKAEKRNALEYYDSEAVMLGAFMPKELKNELELIEERVRTTNDKQGVEWSAEQDEYNSSIIDINDFL
jgi:hypothetical protein